MTDHTIGSGAPQRIGRGKLVRHFVVVFVVTYVLWAIVEGFIEHAFEWSAWSSEDIKLSPAKVVAIVTGAIAWTILGIVTNYNLLLLALSNFIDRVRPEIARDVEKMLSQKGTMILRDTLIESVLVEGMRGVPPKTAFHPYAFEYLRELRSFDDELGPAIEVFASNRLTALRTTTANLKNDRAFDHSLEGHEQVQMSDALAKKATTKIVFYDPKTYDDLERQWSASFKVFIDKTIRPFPGRKLQYLILDDSNFKFIAADSRLTTYANRMKAAGFDVYVIHRSALTEIKQNVNCEQRLEIYDDAVAVKIESKSDYSQADKPKHDLSMTLRTLRNDENLKAFLRALEAHAPRTPR